MEEDKQSRTSVGIDDVTETLLETLRRWTFSLEASTVNPHGVQAACSLAFARRPTIQ